MSGPLDRLRHHVTGAIERGEKAAIVAEPLPVCVVVARVAPRRAWPDKATPVVELLLPYDPANFGNIVAWDEQGGHCEAALSYYHETNPPRSDAECERAVRAVAAYRKCHGNVCNIIERQRLPRDWRAVAWKGQ